MTGPATRTAWLDCAAGIAGDMLLGALLDAGASLEVVRAAVRAVDPALDVRVERTQRHQLDCAKATVLDATTGRPADHDHPTQHDHPTPGVAGTSTHTPTTTHTFSDPPLPVGELRGHAHAEPQGRPHHEGHGHRSWREVRRLLDAAELDPRVRDLALAAFERLAHAEGAVHGVAPDDVTFHEVGALDSIGDIVGCAAALADLRIGHLTASTVALGHGEQVSGAHGRIPIPGPAVTHLTRAAAMPVTGGPVPMELTTPTGAAMLAAWCSAFGPLPTMVVDRVGMGAGTRDPQRLANLVRIVISDDFPDASTSAVEDALVLETNIDDLDPRLWPEAIDALLTAGAHDAWLTPIVMKKGRPAQTLSVLCSPGDRTRVLAVIATHTTTLGVRERPVAKHVFDRRLDTVDVAGQPVDVKVSLSAGEVVGAQPEFDHCRAAATALGVATKEVIARATAAWWATR